MAGAGKGNGKGAGIATGIVFGGFFLLGLVLFGIAATVILSLISIYTPNNSKEPNGDYFKIQAVGLKALYSYSGLSFKNGTVADSTSLSTLCGTMYRSVSSAKNFAGCVAKNFNAYSANNSNTSRRRRQTSESAVTMFGALDLYYSTSCGKQSDINKGSNGTSLSSCVQQRLAECNALVSTTSFTAWTPLSSGMTLSIVDTGATKFNAMSILRIFGLPPSTAVGYASSNGISTSVQSLLSLRCVYGGAKTQAEIAAALAAQSTATTTLPSTTAASG